MMNKVPQNSLVGHQQNPSDGYLNSAFAVISHPFKFVGNFVGRAGYTVTLTLLAGNVFTL